MKPMQERIAEHVTHGGVLVSIISSAINYYSTNEWMVIGIVVGILCSVIGLAANLWFKCRREKLIRAYILNRSRSRAISPDDIELLERD